MCGLSSATGIISYIQGHSLYPRQSCYCCTLLLPSPHLIQMWLYPSSSLLPTLTKALSSVSLHSCTILCASGYRDYLLVCVPKPVVLFKGIGCSFPLPCVSTPLGTKTLESAMARFKSCFNDSYI